MNEKRKKEIGFILTSFYIISLVFLSIPEHSFGQINNDPELLGQQIKDLHKKGQYLKAIPLAERMVEVKINLLGPNHPQVATHLSNLAWLYKASNKYDIAEKTYKNALKIRKSVFGDNHPLVADTLNDLGWLYQDIGNYKEAIDLYERSLEIKEKTLGMNHPKLATTLNNLASINQFLGRHSEAEENYLKALKISQKALGYNHIDVALFYNNLATMYNNQGYYDKAESYYQQSIKVKEKVLGSNHPSLAITLTNLANLYVTIGDYDKAEKLLEKSLIIRENTLGSIHIDVADSLNSLGNLYSGIENYSKAEEFFRRSLFIRKKILGSKHPAVAESLNNLAYIYTFKDEMPNAEKALLDALDIKKEVFGHDHPKVASAYNNIGYFYLATGDYKRAMNNCQMALKTWKSTFGNNYINLSACYRNLASVSISLGNISDSLDYHKMAFEMDERAIDQIFGFTSEEQKINFLLKKRRELYSFFSLINKYFSQNDQAIIEALNVWLKRKGIVLDVQKSFQESLISSDNKKAMKIFQELSEVRTLISGLVFSKHENVDFETVTKRLKKRELEKQKLEGKLSRSSKRFAAYQNIKSTNCIKVAKRLPKDSALIEYVWVKPSNFNPKTKDELWLPAHYFAFILHSGDGKRVHFIDIGKAEILEKAIARFKSCIQFKKYQNESEIFSALKDINDLTFKPLKPFLGDVKKIFISPDGILSLIPFEVLMDPDGNFLIENYTFNYLSSGRDLVGFKRIKEKGSKVVLFGDPDFDLRLENKNPAQRKLELNDVEKKRQGTRYSEKTGFHFRKLPGTKEEIEAIQALIGKDNSKLYTGVEANEEIFWQVKTPSILHLATHGFFLRDFDISDLALQNFDRGILISSKMIGKSVKIENPMLLSGFALAGANNASELYNTGKRDGIMTAENILSLRLQGTDMVVLSACETGVGDVKVGEGVFGLRRAFTQAGAKSLVMSMWSVPDRETKELMINFYRNILSGEMNRCQALRQAALKQMKTVKERYGHSNPFYWGAFVFMGEP